MSPLILLLIASLSQVHGGRSKHNYNTTNCDEFQASFDIGKVLGTWHVVAIIPEKQFPDRDVNCSRMELTETDGAGLKWLVKKTKTSENVAVKLDGKGITVRQRYYTEKPYDVWSKSIEGVNGCFQQVMSLGTCVNETQRAITNAMMQLHLVEADEESGPFLVQMLWGRLISAVIYKRKRAVTQEQLKPMFELISKLRGPQRLPRLCKDPIKDILFF